MGGLHWLHSEVYCFRGPHWPHSSTLTLENTYSQEGVYTGYIQRSTVPEAHTGHIPRHLPWRIFILKEEPTLAICSQEEVYTGYIQRSTVPETHTGHIPQHLLWRIFILKEEPTLAICSQE